MDVHKPPYALVVGEDAFIPKHVLHSQNAHRRMLKMMLVHESHDFKVLFRFANRRVVQLATVYLKQLALPSYAKPFVPFVYKLSKVYFRPAFLQALTKKSRSMVSSPILACRSLTSLSYASSFFAASASPLNARALLDRNSAFHLPIVTALTLYLKDSC